MTSERNVTHSAPFTTKQNDEVYARLVAGDETARDDMIEGNIGLVVYRVDTYLRNAPQMAYYRDDMIGEGFVGLCEAVDNMQRRGAVKKPRPTGYLTRAIDRRIIRFVDEANTIVVSYKAQERAKAKGEILKPPRMVSDKALLGVCDATSSNHNDVNELQEEILACCGDDLERRIVTMRAEGHTDGQIASALKLSRLQVLRRRKAIYQRFKERCPEYLLRKDRHREQDHD